MKNMKFIFVFVVAKKNNENKFYHVKEQPEFPTSPRVCDSTDAEIQPS